MSERDTLYSTADVARRLSLSAAHVRRIAASQGIGVKIGKQRVFTEADIARIAERNTRVGRPQSS